MRAAPARPAPAALALPTHTTWWTHGRHASTAAPTSGRVAADQARAGLSAEELWNDHGQPVYSLACALLGDETAAMRAVALGMVDLVRSDVIVSGHETRRALARHVYRHSTRPTSAAASSAGVPTAMVRLAQLARLQRTSIALCAFGGFTYTEAAELLDIPSQTVAQLLSSGLDELRDLARPAIAT